MPNHTCQPSISLASALFSAINGGKAWEELDRYDSGHHFSVRDADELLDRAITEAIAQGRRPQGMSEDEEIVYEFSTELHKNKQVSDHTFARAEKRFGKQGVVDLTAINAYYTSLAMQMNMGQYQVPKDAKRLARFPR